MKCPKCHRWIEDGSEAHAVPGCMWGVEKANEPTRNLFQAVKAEEDQKATEEDLRKLGLQRVDGESDEEHIAKLKAYIKRSLRKGFGSRGRTWAECLRDKYYAGAELTLVQREAVESALNITLTRDGADAIGNSQARQG